MNSVGYDGLYMLVAIITSEVGSCISYTINFCLALYTDIYTCLDIHARVHSLYTHAASMPICTSVLGFSRVHMETVSLYATVI